MTFDRKTEVSYSHHLSIFPRMVQQSTRRMSPFY